MTMTAPCDDAPALPRGVRSRRLPGEATTSSRLPWAETAVFVTVLPLLSIPVMIATMGAAWAATTGLALTGVIAWLCLARHVVVGQGWIADRRVFRYRVTQARHLRAVELVHNGHGGLLKLHPHGGRPHRLRVHEFIHPQVRGALADIVTASDASVCAGAQKALGLSSTPRALVSAAAPH